MPKLPAAAASATTIATPPMKAGSGGAAFAAPRARRDRAERRSAVARRRARARWCRRRRDECDRQGTNHSGPALVPDGIPCAPPRPLAVRSAAALCAKAKPSATDNVRLHPVTAARKRLQCKGRRGGGVESQPHGVSGIPPRRRPACPHRRRLGPGRRLSLRACCWTRATTSPAPRATCTWRASTTWRASASASGSRSSP